MLVVVAVYYAYNNNNNVYSFSQQKPQAGFTVDELPTITNQPAVLVLVETRAPLVTIIIYIQVIQ